MRDPLQQGWRQWLASNHRGWRLVVGFVCLLCLSPNRLVEGAPAHFLPQQMELVLAGVLGGQLFGGAAEVPGELRHRADVTLDGHGGQVAQLQIFGEPLS